MNTLLYIIGWLLWIAFGLGMIVGIVMLLIFAYGLILDWYLDHKDIKKALIEIRQREDSIE